MTVLETFRYTPPAKLWYRYGGEPSQLRLWLLAVETVM